MKTDQFQNLPFSKTIDEATKFTALYIVAMEGKHKEFEFIRCWEHHKIAKLFLSGLKRIVRSFKKVSRHQDKLVKDLRKEGKADLINIAFAEQLHTCIQFYKKECAIVKDMLSEYREYVCSGHLIDTFIIPRLRTDYELVDYRTLPGVWMFKKPK